MIKSKIQIYSGEHCTDLEMGCYINFIPTSSEQFIPPESKNYLISLDGSAKFVYDTGEIYYAIPIHTSSEWMEYQNPWKYNTVVAAKTYANTRVLQIHMVDDDTSSLTFKAKRIQNETLDLHTNANSIMIGYGSNLTVNGNVSQELLVEYNSSESNNYIIATTGTATIIVIEKP